MSPASARNQWAYHCAARTIGTDYNVLHAASHLPGRSGKLIGGPDSRPGFLKDPIDLDKPLPKPPALPGLGSSFQAGAEPLKVCIVGAGAAGLFTGLLFDYLHAETGGLFKVDYDILEAAGEDRVGGRLYTYYFDKNVQHSHQYYDVGAMRFPDNPVMARTFALFKYLGMHKKELSEATTGDLVPYSMTNMKNKKQWEPFCFNDITKWGGPNDFFKKGIDTFGMNVENRIPQTIFAFTPSQVIGQAIDQIKQYLEVCKDDKQAWKVLMSLDGYSTRQYLSGEPVEIPLPPPQGASDDPPPQPYNYATIEWLEIFNGGTNWYDQAHCETVLEAIDFDYDMPDGKPVDWRCILGGAQQLAIKMQDKLLTKPHYNVRVTAFVNDEANRMRVTTQTAGVDSVEQTETYHSVFNSTTLGALQQIDTSQAKLSYGVKAAMRSLGYGGSSKVGIKFKTPWWRTRLGEDYNIQSGGLGHCDMTIRTCVYPSYNIEDPENGPAVLLCSYTWQQDGDRMGALINGDSEKNPKPDDQNLLRNILTHDLAMMHQNDSVGYKELYEIIRENYIEHNGHNWNADPNTLGAFAFFRPQQFRSMWPDIIQPTRNFALIGEAASPHHAWVVGALESVVHQVYVWLGQNTDIPGAAKARGILAGEASTNLPFPGLPPYMDTNVADWHSWISVAMQAQREAEEHQRQ